MRANEPIDLNKGIQHRRLGELNRLIRDSFEISEQLAAKAKLTANQAIAERILFGRYLREMKGIVGHGRWLTWLATHRPEITEDKAQRAMRLAKHAHLLDLSQPLTMRQAFVVCGILPEDMKAMEGVAVAPAPVYLRAVETFTRWRSSFEKNPVTEWPQEARERLKHELEPIVRVLWPEAAPTIPPGKESLGGAGPQGG